MCRFKKIRYSRWGFLLAWLWMGLTLTAQSVDDWEKELADSGISKQRRIALLNLLARDLSYVKPLQSIEYAKEALFLSQENNDKSGMAYAYRNLAGAYSYFGSFYLTMYNLQKATALFESLGDSAGIANCHISLGHTYRRLRKRQEEIANHRKAYEIFSRLGIPDRIGVSAHNLGESYLNNGQLNESEALTRKAIVILDSLNNGSVLSSCYKVMGKIWWERKKYDSARYYFQEVLALSEQLGEYAQKIATVESLIALAKIDEAQGNSGLTLDRLNDAALYVRTNQMGDYVMPVYMKLIEEYTRLQKREQVLNALNELKETQEKITTQQLEDRAKMMQSLSEVFALEEKYNQMQAQQWMYEQQIRNRNLLLIISFAAALVLLVFMVLLIKGNRKLKRYNRLLQEQKQLIQKQHAELKELNATKDKFFSIVSHDLRAPLNALWSFSSIITEGIDKLSREQLLSFSAQLRQVVERAMKMTDNLITWAKIQMQEFSINVSSFALAPFVRDICKLYEDIAADKQITLHYQLPDDLWVLADNNQIAFIVRNLVNNAIKYTPKGGTIHISAYREDQQVYLTIKDSGIGMDAATLEKIFGNEPVKSRAGTAGEVGTGLGIKLSRSFAAMNRGTLTAASEFGNGTTFTLSLPAAVPPKEV